MNVLAQERERWKNEIVDDFYFQSQNIAERHFTFGCCCWSFVIVILWIIAEATYFCQYCHSRRGFGWIAVAANKFHRFSHHTFVIEKIWKEKYRKRLAGFVVSERARVPAFVRFENIIAETKYFHNSSSCMNFFPAEFPLPRIRDVYYGLTLWFFFISSNFRNSAEEKWARQIKICTR